MISKKKPYRKQILYASESDRFINMVTLRIPAALGLCDCCDNTNTMEYRLLSHQHYPVLCSWQQTRKTLQEVNIGFERVASFLLPVQLEHSVFQRRKTI